MSSLAHQRCRNHAHREAVARCPECHRYFCRECITEHNDRVVCSSCLRMLVSPTERKQWRVGVFFQAAQFLFGLLLIWFCFYSLGRALLQVPSDFHEQTLWQVGPYEGIE